MCFQLALHRLGCTRCSQWRPREQQRGIVRVRMSLAQAPREHCRRGSVVVGSRRASIFLARRGLSSSLSCLWLQTAGAVEEMCGRFAKASLVVDKAGRRDIGMLCELLNNFLRRKALELIETAGGRPILLSYSSDGTPLTTRERLRL